MSVKRARQEISWQEFKYWVAYDSVDPYGRERDDLHAGIISSTIANVHRSKNMAVYKPSGFMPDFDKEVKTQTPKQIWNMFSRFTKAFNRKK